MANDLTNIMPKILARGLLALRQICIMPQIVNGDYSAQAAEKGTTIDVPISTAMTAVAVTPSYLPPNPGDSTPGKVQISLDQWYKNPPFYLTDNELVQVDDNSAFLPLQVAEAIKCLANQVNATIHAQYKGIYGYVGTAGTTPFGTPGVHDATKARMNLNRQLAPKQDRRAVLNFDAEEAFLALAQISDAEKIGSNDVKLTGEIGHKFGIDWYAEDEVKTHTTGAAGTVLINTGGTNGVALAGGTLTANGYGGTVGMDGLTTVASPGDVFTVAGDTQTYVVVTASALVSTSTSVTFMPAAKVAWADNAAVTFKASHVVNLAFHRDAFAFATRPLLQNTLDMGMGNRILSMQDPITGLVMRLEIMRQYKQTMWEFDMLWGTKLVRPDLATRIAG